jgi:ankyrin repeat protein
MLKCFICVVIEWEGKVMDPVQAMNEYVDGMLQATKKHVKDKVAFNLFQQTVAAGCDNIHNTQFQQVDSSKYKSILQAIGKMQKIEEIAQKQFMPNESAEIANFFHQQVADISNRNLFRGETLLSLAIQKGSLEEIKLLFKMGVNLDIKIFGAEKMSALHRACELGRKDVVEYLLEKGANKEVKNYAGDTPLHIACKEGKYDIVKLLLDRGADIESRSDDQKTPLHKAAENGSCKVIAALLQHNAYVEAKDKFGRTPLFFAGGKKDGIKLLLGRGANIEAQDEFGETPLIHEIRTRGNIESFLENGADVNAQFHSVVSQEDGFTCLHFACKYDVLDKVKLILKYKPDLNIRSQGGKTAFHTACETGTCEIIQLLLKNKQDVNVQDFDGNTPLHLAASKFYIDAVKLLLKNKAALETKNKEGSTPLCSACAGEKFLAFGMEETLALLVAKGANINTANNAGNTPLHLACLTMDLNCIEELMRNRANHELLLAQGMNHDIFHVAYEKNPEKFKNFFPQFLKKLPQNFAKTLCKAQNKDGNSLLHLACKKGDDKLIGAMLDLGVSVNIKNKHNETVVHLLCMHGNFPRVQSLINEHKINAAALNAKDNKGFTPLSCAWDYRKEVFDQLEQAKQECINSLSDQNMQLQYVAKYRYIRAQDLYDKLIAAGARLPVRTSDGSTLHTDLKDGNIDLVIATLKQDKEAIELAPSRDRDGNTLLHLACCKSSTELIAQLVGKAPWNGMISCRNNAGKTPLRLLLESNSPSMRNSLSAIFIQLGVKNPATIIPEKPEKILKSLAQNPNLLITNFPNPIEFAYLVRDIDLARTVAGKLAANQVAAFCKALNEKYPTSATGAFIDSVHYDVTIEKPKDAEKEKLLKASIGLPEKVPQVELATLNTLFDKINYTDPEKSEFVDPLHEFHDTLAQVKDKITKLLTDLKQQELHGIPKRNPAYGEMEARLKCIIDKFLSLDYTKPENRQLLASSLRELVSYATYCGPRIYETILATYQHVVSSLLDFDTLAKVERADIYKTSMLKFIDEKDEQSIHNYLKISKEVSAQTPEFGTPEGWKLAQVPDPYGGHYVVDVPRVGKQIKEDYVPTEIIDRMCIRYNEEESCKDLFDEFVGSTMLPRHAAADPTLGKNWEWKVSQITPDKAEECLFQEWKKKNIPDFTDLPETWQENLPDNLKAMDPLKRREEYIKLRKNKFFNDWKKAHHIPVGRLLDAKEIGFLTEEMYRESALGKDWQKEYPKNMKRKEAYQKMQADFAKNAANKRPATVKPEDYFSLRWWADKTLGAGWEKNVEKGKTEYEYMLKELFFAHYSLAHSEFIDKAVANPIFRPNILDPKLRAQAKAKEFYLRDKFVGWVEGLTYYDNGRKVKREAMSEALSQVGILKDLTVK